MRATFYTLGSFDDEGETELRVECSGDIIEAEPEVGLNETTLQDVEIDKVTTHPDGQDVTAMCRGMTSLIDEAHDAIWEARDAEREAREADKDAAADHHFEMWKQRKGTR